MIKDKMDIRAMIVKRDVEHLSNGIELNTIPEEDSNLNMLLLMAYYLPPHSAARESGAGASQARLSADGE